MSHVRQYVRDDISYDSWYSDWSKRLAKQMTLAKIEKEIKIADSATKRAAKSHLSAIQKTHSMQSNSQRRAQSKNVLIAAGEYKSALSGALEIHELFPEHASQAKGIVE